MWFPNRTIKCIFKFLDESSRKKNNGGQKGSQERSDSARRNAPSLVVKDWRLACIVAK